MWVLKFRIKNCDSIYTLLTEKFKVTDYFYSIEFRKVGKKLHILGVHFLHGDDAEKKRFAQALRKHPRTLQFEQYEDRIVVLMEEDEHFYELLYNPALYQPAPTTTANGYESWTVASWDRPMLGHLIEELRKDKKCFPEIELQSIEKSKLTDIYFPQVLPDLPDRQQIAFQLAVQLGYYTVPRKITLAGLAKAMKISLSTYQEHLRKAEAKLLPFFGQHIK